MSDTDGTEGGDYISRTESVNFDREELYSQHTANLKEIGAIVFSEVWNEFYSWEPDQCRQLLRELKPWARYSCKTNADLHASLDRPLHSMDIDIDMNAEINAPWVQIYDNEGVCTKMPVSFEEVVLSGNFEPYPKYESCTPTSKNIALRRDALVEADRLEFIPYGDEPEFDADMYVRHADELGWQVDWRDPDSNKIVFLFLYQVDGHVI